MNLENYLVKSNISVLDTMRAIDKGAKGIVYVCDDRECLLGAVTDGNVRRHLIHGGSLSAPVTSIMNPRPISLPFVRRLEADECMERHSITSVPVVDYDNTVIEIFFRDSYVRNKHNLINSPVAIMAGGKGTRLAPYTQILPKPLIPVGEKTITEHIIDRFLEYGCNRFDIIVNYKRHLIKSYFRDTPLDAEINFFDEDEFLGTAGGLHLLKGRYNEPFFMTNCDIIIEDDYAGIMKYHKESGNIITIVSAVMNLSLPYGVIDTNEDGLVTSIHEKPEISNIVNTGFYVLNPEFPDMIPENTFIHITDVIKQCIDQNKKVGMYPVSGDRWMDMGKAEELKIMIERLENI